MRAVGKRIQGRLPLLIRSGFVEGFIPCQRALYNAREEFLDSDAVRPRLHLSTGLNLWF